MRVGVASIHGLHGVNETLKVFGEDLGCETFIIKETEESIKETDLVVIPGGFSYGDFLRPGALAKVSPVCHAIKKYANNEGLVLGIGNGFQILTELELLPGILLVNSTQSFYSGWISVRLENNNSKLSRGMDLEKVYKFPIGCYYGCYYADLRTLGDLESHGQVLFRYSNRFGDVDKNKGLNGSVNSIAGVMNKKGNVFGIMFHLERADQGVDFFRSLVVK